MDFYERLHAGLLYFDGALGTNLQRLGLKAGEEPAFWSLTHPQELAAVHREFLEAGCDMITANTFGANCFKMEKQQAEQAIHAALRIVKQQIAQSGRQAFAALDIGPTGRFLKPFGDLRFSDCYAAYAEMVCVGQAAGADVIIIETMNDTLEMKAAVLAAKEHSTLPVLASFTLDANGRLLMGGGVDCVHTLLEGLGVDAIGVNCGFGPDMLTPYIRQLSEQSRLPLLVMPNAGLPRLEQGETYYDITPEQFARQMRELLLPGVCLLGGCCGTTAQHLRETIALCGRQAERRKALRETKLVSSYAKTQPVQGSEIAMLSGADTDTLVGLAMDAQDEGKAIIGVPLATASQAEQLIPALQMVVTAPLCLESDNMRALEQAARLYNGVPLLRYTGAPCAEEASIAKKYCANLYES